MATESIIEACKKVLVDEFGGDGDIAKKNAYRNISKS